MKSIYFTNASEAGVSDPKSHEVLSADIDLLKRVVAEDEFFDRGEGGVNIRCEEFDLVRLEVQVFQFLEVSEYYHLDLVVL